MKKNKIIFFALVVLLIACNSRPTMTALEYSNRVVEMEQSLAEPIRLAENAIKNFADAGDYKSMADAADIIQDTLDVRIQAIKDADVSSFKGGEEFKRVAVRYFEYIKSIYTQYSTIANAKDKDARKEASERMQTILSAQEEVRIHMRAAQETFALQNGFRIEESLQ